MADSLFYLQWKRPDGFLPPRRGNHAGPVQRRAAVAVTGNRRSGGTSLVYLFDSNKQF